MFQAFKAAASAALLGAVALPAAAGDKYEVEIRGTVEFNGIGSGPLSNVQPGEATTLTFELDSDLFVDSPNFPTRGYLIDKDSFVMAFESGSMGLQSPYTGPEPLFVIRDNDPAVDGFIVSTNVDGLDGVPLQVPGIFGPFLNAFHVTYGGDLLDSLDIAGAVGTYDFTGLTVFNWTIDDGPFNPFGLIFSDMTITPIAAGSASPYGCGVNPDGSLTVTGGSPTLGSTLDLGVDNPLGTQAPGSIPAILIAFAPDPAYPCGLPVPGFGMSGPGAPGEVLVALVGPNLFVTGAPWAGPGMPAPFPIAIPDDPVLVTAKLYVQGVIVDPIAAGGVPIGLTGAVEITIGN